MGDLRSVIRRNAAAAIATALLVALCFAAYGNNFHHAYHLDDAYTLVSNPSVRSLGMIPQYFVDPGTYTSLREQADYRPVLQVTYAINYRLGGYSTPWWHFTQVLLHALVAIGIWAFVRRLLLLSADPPSRPDIIALIAAAIFAIHPAASGVVNYFNARSSLLTAVFLLPALLAYLRPREREEDFSPRWASAGWLALALFTKVEAVGALGAMWAAEVWRRAQVTPGLSLQRAIRDSFDTATLRRLAPSLAVTLAYFVIRAVVMAPFPFDETRSAPDVGAYEYFLTQLTAWWHYVARWIAPVSLVADHLAYPVIRSALDPRALLAIGGWGLVVTLLIATFRRAPAYTFLAIAALALISPTSSVAPLAEMVNEHRPYLPVGLLMTGLTAMAGHRLRRGLPHAPRWLGAGALATVLSALAILTWQRNLAFRTPASYWRDVLDKAPSARAHLNYGLALAGSNDVSGALSHYREALRLAPYWYYTHINLGVIHGRLGQADSARHWYDRAVDNDRYSGHALTWRGEFFLSRKEYAAARADFERSAATSLQTYRNARGLATAYAGQGNVDSTLAQTARLISIDSGTALTDVPGIATPFFDNPALHRSGVDYFRRLEERVGQTWWIPENISRLERLLARQQGSAVRGR